MWAVSVPSNAYECFSADLDTIWLNGRILDIDAQIRWDSIRIPGESPPIRHALFGNQRRHARVSLVRGSMEWGGWASNDGDLVHWSRKSDVAWTVAMGRERQWESLKFARSHGVGQWVIGARAMRLLYIDSSLFPDSLIGFSAATSSSPLRAITFERFPIGVETDTVEVSITRQLGVSLLAGFGIEQRFKNGWTVSGMLGFDVLIRSQSRLDLEHPELDRGAAFHLTTWNAGTVMPWLEGDCSYSIRNKGQQVSRWGIGFRWQPNGLQPTWLGIKGQMTLIER